jgi:hypothetical protein
VFTLPQFNTLADVYRRTLVSWTLIHHNLPCQLYVNSRLTNDQNEDLDDNIVVILRVPKGTGLVPRDVYEVPPGSGWWYAGNEVERVHLGFPNEYEMCGVENQNGGSGGPPAGIDGFILMELTGYILMEDGLSLIGME